MEKIKYVNAYEFLYCYRANTQLNEFLWLLLLLLQSVLDLFSRLVLKPGPKPAIMALAKNMLQILNTIF